MRALNQHLRERIDMFDKRFRRGHLHVPQALSAAIETECHAMGLEKRHAVVTVGPPMNFMTFGADLEEYLFRLIDLDLLPAFDEDEDIELVLISVPEIEGVRAAWQPMTVGHEIAHYLQTSSPIKLSFSLNTKMDKVRLASFTDAMPPAARGQIQSRAIEQIAARWLNELFCDAFAVYRYGSAAVAAMADFSEFVGATTFIGHVHPPAGFRILLMLNWLKGRTGSNDDEIVHPFLEIAEMPSGSDWAQYLCEVFLGLAQSIWEDLAGWASGDAYNGRDQQLVVSRLSDLLNQGIPGSEQVNVGSGSLRTSSADVLNATWLAIQRGSEMPVNRLATKALDTLDFLDRWREAGGGEGEVGSAGIGSALGVLTDGELRRRVASSAADRLVVTPLLPGAIGGASIDLRLGNKFVVFERSNAAAFDALNPDQDPASMQRLVEKSWGDVFYLHPGQLVLAATLEYLTLPGDLTAQVITRSSYGRLGLLSATAVQVHPYYAGCLTLELVNLGEMPMVITPGERVAQLVLSTTGGIPPSPAGSEKYRFPTSPEFSKIRNDSESVTLRRFRDQFSNGPAD
jgi:deoxycytidine triphosphate deaminase